MDGNEDADDCGHRNREHNGEKNCEKGEDDSVVTVIKSHADYEAEEENNVEIEKEKSSRGIDIISRHNNHYESQCSEEEKENNKQRLARMKIRHIKAADQNAEENEGDSVAELTHNGAILESDSVTLLFEKYSVLSTIAHFSEQIDKLHINSPKESGVNTCKDIDTKLYHADI